MNDVLNILRQASAEERNGLQRIMEIEDSSAEALVKEYRWLHRNLFEDFYRDVFGEQESYRDIVRSVCQHLKIDFRKYETASELENRIAQKVMETVWSKMTAEQRAEMEAEIAKVAEQYGKGGEWRKAGGVAGLIVAGELGGFATFTLASSSLAAIAGVVGLTLPFAVYTTMSTVLGVVLGPVGWIGAGIFAIWKVTGPNFKKLIPATLYISMLRNKPRS